MMSMLLPLCHKPNPSTSRTLQVQFTSKGPPKNPTAACQREPICRGLVQIWPAIIRFGRGSHLDRPGSFRWSVRGKGDGSF